MRFKTLIMLCGLLCMVPNSWAQDKKISLNINEQTQKAMFESTYWIPKRGVKLLNEESALGVWEKYHGANSEQITALSVFETETMHLLVFNVAYIGTHWAIYTRKDGKLDFYSESISGGYGSKGPKDFVEGCSAGQTSTKVNFRQYTKEGPLLLEVYIPGCREGAAHHEFLFHIDGEKLEEVKGSRFVMNDYYNHTEDEKGWRFWPKNDKYVRIGKVSWSDEGEMKWTRKFNTRLICLSSEGGRGIEYDFPQPEVHRHCHYSKTLRAVQCENEVVKEVILKAEHFFSYHYDLDRSGDRHLREALKVYPHMEEAGHILSTKELAKIKRRLSNRD